MIDGDMDMTAIGDLNYLKQQEAQGWLDHAKAIGMEKLEPLRRFLTGLAKGRFEPANGEATLSGVYVETDDKTGLAQKVRMIRVGGKLQESVP